MKELETWPEKVLDLLGSVLVKGTSSTETSNWPVFLFVSCEDPKRVMISSRLSFFLFSTRELDNVSRISMATTVNGELSFFTSFPLSPLLRLSALFPLWREIPFPSL